MGIHEPKKDRSLFIINTISEGAHRARRENWRDMLDRLFDVCIEISDYELVFPEKIYNFGVGQLITVDTILEYMFETIGINSGFAINIRLEFASSIGLALRSISERTCEDWNDEDYENKSGFQDNDVFCNNPYIRDSKHSFTWDLDKSGNENYPDSDKFFMVDKEENSPCE